MRGSKPSITVDLSCSHTNAGRPGSKSFSRSSKQRRAHQVIGTVCLLILTACNMSGRPLPDAKAPPPLKPYAGAQARFAKPATATQRLVLKEPAVRGYKFQVTDEDGPFWVALSRNHDATAGIANDVKVSDGRWWVDPNGLLCLKSSVWWTKGTCFELFGGTRFVDANIIHSLNKENGPNTYYPFTVLGPMN